MALGYEILIWNLRAYQLMTHFLAQSTIIFSTRAESQICQEAGQKPEVALVVCAFLHLSFWLLRSKSWESCRSHKWPHAGNSSGIIGE